MRHLIKLLSVLFALSFGQTAWANCTVNSVNYKTIGGSGTAITTAIIKNRASSWNNATDLITTCDVSSITDMTDMFKNNLTFNQDLSAWDTGAVTSMKNMFSGATSLTEVSLPQTGKVKNMREMFQDATALITVSLPTTGKVTDMSNMFNGASSLTSVTLPDTGNVGYMYGMFANASSLTSVSLPTTGKVTIMSYMFNGASSLTTVSLPQTGNVGYMISMFYNASAFNQDIRGWDVSNVTYFNAMFYGATAMATTFGGTSNWPADNSTPTSAWFTPVTPIPSNSEFTNAITACLAEAAVTGNCTTYGASSGYGTMPHWDTSQVTNMSSAFENKLSFNGDLSAWNTSDVTDMNRMFYNATSLTSVSLSTTGKVTNMSYMFYNANSLTSVSLPTTGKVQYMYRMFYAARALTSVTLPQTGEVTDMNRMFYNATSLTSVTLPTTGKVTNMRLMFGNATSLTSVSLPQTGEVTNMSNMFSGASAFNQDIRGWDVADVTNFDYMFKDATAMATAFGGTSNWPADNSTPTSAWFSDTIAPTLSSVSIASSNATPTQAVENDVVTLTLTASETISTPVVTFKSGAVAITDTSITYVNTSGNIWTAAYTVNANDTSGAVTFSVAFSDIAATGPNAGTAVTSAAGSVTASLDTTAPTLSNVSLASSNATTTEGFAGDVVTLTFTASETITNPVVTFKSGGAAITDTSVTYVNASGTTTWTAAYTVNASDTAGAVTYSIAYSDSAGNAGAAVTSGTGSVTIYPTPAAAFAAELTKINAKIASFAQAELNNLSSTMSRISSTARGRFIAQMKGSQIKVSSSEPDYSGGFTTSGGKIDTNLTMTKSSKSYNSLYTTYTSADVFFNRNEDDNFSRGAAGQMQFERMLSDKTMLGYFVGGSVGLMNEGGTLTTSMEAVGLKLGSYFVRELDGNLILDGYASVVTSSNNLRFTTDLMTAKSNYNTQAGALGLNLTGIIPLASMEIRPTGSLSLTRSIGQTVNFDVTVGSASSTETATHGSITQSKLSFAPEVRMPFSQTSFGGSSVATFTPKVTCQEVSKTTTTRSCGQGIAIGMDTISKDGLTNVIMGTSFDQMGGQSSTSIDFKVMKRW